MAKKTMLRQLISKWGIMSVEMEKAYVGDQAVLKEDMTPDYYIDNIPDEPQKAVDVLDVEGKEVTDETDGQ